MNKKIGLAAITALLILMLCPVLASAAARTDTDIATYDNGIWKKVNGVKYCYDPDNRTKKITGWATIGKNTYYFSKKGAMQTGLKKISGKLYYFEASGLSGAMVTGARTVSGNRYYFDKKSGAAKAGSFSVGKKTYYARKTNNVLLVSTWRKVSGTYHYYDSKGVQHSKWFTVGSKKYFCHPSKGRLSGWKKLYGEYYYFNSKGYVEVNKWINKGSQRCFVDDTGAVVKTISSTTPTSNDYGEIIMIGDSRFARAYESFAITASNVKYICKRGEGYNWLYEEGFPSVQAEVERYNRNALYDGSRQKIALVFNLGVNDLTNITKYLTYMNNSVTSFAMANNCDLYYVSVNPVDEEKFSANLAAAKTKTLKKITSFNKKLVSGLNSRFTYIDTSSYLKKRFTYAQMTLSDGIHYNRLTSQVIFNRILLNVKPSVK